MSDSADADGLDNLINEIGLGRWQVLGLVANFLIWFVLSPHTIGTTLYNAPVPFHCSRDSSHLKSQRSGDTYGRLNASTFYNNNCFNQTLKDTIIVPLGTNETLLTPLPSCPIVQYDQSVFESTVTTEWNLICENSHKRTLFQDFYTVGLILGCIFGGTIADRLGRVRAVLLGSIVHSIVTCVVAFTTNLFLLFFARFIVGLTNHMILVAVVTLALETCPQKARGPIGLLVGLPYSLGVVVFACIGIALRNWRHLYMAISFPALLLVPVTWFLDESPRWLLQVNDFDESKRIVDKAIKANRSDINPKINVDEILKSVMPLDESGDKKISLKDKLKNFLFNIKQSMSSKAMCKINIISPLVWCINEIIYYGIIFNANEFSGDNPFLYVALTGIADGVAILLGVPCTKYLGRRATVAGSQFISASLILLVLITPDEMKWIQWVLIMVGFLMCACASQSLFVYTPELFPTSIRARGFAFSTVAGSVGTLIAPVIPEVLAKLSWWVTGVTLGALGYISCSMVLCLPETNHLPLCETIQDVEEREKKARKKPTEQTELKNIKDTPIHKAPIAKPENDIEGIDNPALTKDSY